MIALIIIIVFLLILNFTPFGVDGRYEDSALSLFVRVGPFQAVRILPARELTEDEKRQKELKKAEKKAKKKSKKDGTSGDAKAKTKKKPDRSLIAALIPMVLHALKRLRHRLSIDLFKLHFTAGGDPYSAAMSYGYVSACFGTVLPILDSAFNISEWDVRASVDFDSDHSVVDAGLIITIQLWELVYIAAAFAAEFLKYKINSRNNIQNAAETETRLDAA